MGFNIKIHVFSHVLNSSDYFTSHCLGLKFRSDLCIYKYVSAIKFSADDIIRKFAVIEHIINGQFNILHISFTVFSGNYVFSICFKFGLDFITCSLGFGLCEEFLNNAHVSLEPWTKSLEIRLCNEGQIFKLCSCFDFLGIALVLDNIFKEFHSFQYLLIMSYDSDITYRPSELVSCNIPCSGTCFDDFAYIIHLGFKLFINQFLIKDPVFHVDTFHSILFNAFYKVFIYFLG